MLSFKAYEDKYFKVGHRLSNEKQILLVQDVLTACEDESESLPHSLYVHSSWAVCDFICCLSVVRRPQSTFLTHSPASASTSCRDPPL